MQDKDKAQDQAAAQYEGICAMIAAANMDWDRLEELKAEELDHEERLEELRDMRAEHEADMADETDPKPWEIAYPDEAEELAAMESDGFADAEELAELRDTAGDCEDYEEAMQRIYEDPLEVQFRSGWASSGEDLTPEEFYILLCTGGPAVRIMGELGFDGEPSRAWLEYQDWGTPWTQYFGASQDVLLDYARWNISL